VRLPGLPGSEEFMAAYTAALTASTPRSDIGISRSQPGTVAALVAVYCETAEFKHEIAPETRRTQWAILQRFRNEHGDKPVHKLKREHVLAILAGKRPYPKRNWLRALRPLMRFAVSIGMVAADPTQDIKANVPRKGGGFQAWGEKEIAAFRAHHPIGSRARLAFELLLNTVQRRADVIRMGPQHICDGLLYVQQSKTGERLRLPIAPVLQAVIDAAPSVRPIASRKVAPREAPLHLTFLTTQFGKPFTGSGFGNWFREVCNEAGLHGFSAHGLRKAGCRRLAEAGCSAHEIAAWSGHRTLSEVAHYTRAADQTAMARAALAKVGTSLSNIVGASVKLVKKASKGKG
jgi:integrase